MPIESYPSTRAMPSFPGTNLSLIDGGTLYGAIDANISAFDPVLYTSFMWRDPPSVLLIRIGSGIRHFKMAPRKEKRKILIMKSCSIYSHCKAEDFCWNSEYSFRIFFFVNCRFLHFFFHLSRQGPEHRIPNTDVGSVADPGCLSRIRIFPSRILDPGSKRFRIRTKNCF